MNTVSVQFATKTYLQEVFIVLAMSFLIGLAAPISIPLFFTPVPITLQGSLILMLSILLGGKRTAIAVMVFLTQGALGLPVFANCTAGFTSLLGCSGGYLFSYVAAAWVTGFLHQSNSTKNILWAMSIGNGIIFLFGAIWLSFFVGCTQAILLGVVPFILGDIIKLLMAVKCVQFFRKSL